MDGSMQIQLSRMLSNYCEKDVGMGLCQYATSAFMHHPFLVCILNINFWHAIPTSFYTFIFLLLYFFGVTQLQLDLSQRRVFFQVR